MISIIVITFNRLKLLKLCVEQVLARTSDEARQIIIWNNASTDGTTAYLNTLDDPRITVVNHTKNIGTNARGRAFAMAQHEHIISLDDDVVDAPENWDKTLRDAFDQLPGIGFMAANIIDDGKGTHAEYMFRQRDLNAAESQTINGVEIIPGWAGNWCAITSRQLYKEAGGFQESSKFVYWNEDNAYTKQLAQMGYGNCLLKNLKVFHAAGPYYVNDENIQKAKKKYQDHKVKYRKKNARKAKIKQLLEQFALTRYLNAKFKFYQVSK